MAQYLEDHGTLYVRIDVPQSGLEVIISICKHTVTIFITPVTVP